MNFEVISKQFTSVRFEKNVLLKIHSSMKTGGVAQIAFFPESKQVLVESLRLFEKSNVKYSVIGNASNLLFSDDGYADRIIVFTCRMKEQSIENGCVTALCGVSLTSLALAVSKSGLTGLEFAYGIPGTVGGAVYMNAGAYGGQMSDIVVETEYFDPDTLEVKKIAGQQHNFGYRQSFFHGSNKIILQTKMLLKPCNAELAVKLCEENMGKRISKQPLKFPSCGSAFKRPEGHFAGALIEQCGLKGFTVGGAQVSEMHAGFVINAGGATTADVIELMKRVGERVKDKFGIVLEPEILVLE